MRLAGEYGRYGYRRIIALLWASGWRVNARQVERLWRREVLAWTASECRTAMLHYPLFEAPNCGLFKCLPLPLWGSRSPSQPSRPAREIR